MDLEQLKQQAIAVPFIPFVVVLKGGHKILLTRRYQLAVSPLSTYFIVEDQGKTRRLDVDEIENIENVPTVSAH